MHSKELQLKYKSVCIKFSGAVYYDYSCHVFFHSYFVVFTYSINGIWYLSSSRVLFLHHYSSKCLHNNWLIANWGVLLFSLYNRLHLKVHIASFSRHYFLTEESFTICRTFIIPCAIFAFLSTFPFVFTQRVEYFTRSQNSW